MSVDATEIDNSSIWLYPSSDKAPEGFIRLNFFASDPDGDGKEFEPIVYTAIGLLAQDHVVLYEAYYSKEKEGRHRLFGGWRPARFSTRDGASMLKQRLIDSGWQDGLFADIETYEESRFLWSKERRYQKRLCILQEKLDMELLRQTDFTYCGLSEHMQSKERYTGVGLRIFPEQTIRHLEAAETTIKHYDAGGYMLFFIADIEYPRAEIILDPQYISIDELTEKLRQAAAMHNKKLEVEI